MKKPQEITKKETNETFIYPPAEFLESLHKINPEMLVEFMSRSYVEQSHNHKVEIMKLETEKKKINFDFFSFIIGNSFAILSLLIVLLFTYYMVISGHENIATSTIIASLALLTGVFIYSKKK